MSHAFRERMKKREHLIGTLLSLPSPETAEICAEAGFDWLFIDMEHGLLGLADVQRMIQAAAGRAACVVRVARNDSNLICRALDTGADGIIVPHVNDAGDAQAAAQSAKYSPLGTRSIGIARAQGYGTRVAESLERANRETVLIVQAEHVEASRNIEDILAVPGVDAVFIGPFDLSASLGLPGRIGDPEVLEAIARIRDACVAEGVPAGIFVRDAEGARKAASEGFAFVCAATDSLLLSQAARRLLSEARTR